MEWAGSIAWLFQIQMQQGLKENLMIGSKLYWLQEVCISVEWWLLHSHCWEALYSYDYQKRIIQVE